MGTQTETLEWRVKIPEKKIEGKAWLNLKKRVIDTGLCTHCSACALVCPVGGIISSPNQEIDFPEWEENCIDCGACIRACHRWEYTPLYDLGDYIDLTAGKSKRFKGQDGAMVTEFMASALEMGLIDRALFVGRDDEWRPVIYHIRSVDQLKNTRVTGTKYSYASVLPELKKAVEVTKKGVGVIGTPCIVTGVRKLQSEFKVFRDKINLVVGLFCMENFYYYQLRAYLEKKGVDLKKLVKMDITKGKFIATMTDSKVSFPVKEMDEIVPHGCESCTDFANVLADVSVGSVGSKAGYSTVVVRAEVGKKVLDYIKDKGYADFSKVNPEIIEKLTKLKKKRIKNIPEEYLSVAFKEDRKKNRENKENKENKENTE